MHFYRKLASETLSITSRRTTPQGRTRRNHFLRVEMRTTPTLGLDTTTKSEPDLFIIIIIITTKSCRYLYERIIRYYYRTRIRVAFIFTYSRNAAVGNTCLFFFPIGTRNSCHEYYCYYYCASTRSCDFSRKILKINSAKKKNNKINK